MAGQRSVMLANRLPGIIRRRSVRHLGDEHGRSYEVMLNLNLLHEVEYRRRTRPEHLSRSEGGTGSADPGERRPGSDDPAAERGA